MEHSDFKINDIFYTWKGVWKCTDIGMRTVIAIRFDEKQDPSWFKGPPYMVEEYVFNESDFPGCRLEKFKY